MAMCENRDSKNIFRSLKKKKNRRLIASISSYIVIDLRVKETCKDIGSPSYMFITTSMILTIDTGSQ